MENENFDNLTKKQKAVLVAQDVIKWLDSKRMVAQKMVYCELSVSLPAGSLQESLNLITTRTPCKVCGIGAMFIAAVDRFNRFDLTHTTDYVPQGLMRGHLSDIFTVEELSRIEYAFEAWYSEDDLEDTDPDYVAGRKYADDSSADTRLRKICENIIENGGEFVV